jgi:hypothetical protein
MALGHLLVQDIDILRKALVKWFLVIVDTDRISIGKTERLITIE